MILSVDIEVTEVMPKLCTRGIKVYCHMLWTLLRSVAFKFQRIVIKSTYVMNCMQVKV